MPRATFRLYVLVPFSQCLAILSIAILPLGAQWQDVKLTSSPRSRLGAADQVIATMARGQLTVVGTDDSVVRYLVVRGPTRIMWTTQGPLVQGHSANFPTFDPNVAVRAGTEGFTERWGSDGLTLTTTDTTVVNGLRIEVPRHIKRLQLQVGVGFITVEYFDGEISAKTSRGGMHFEGNTGPVVAEANGGDIRALFTKLPPASSAGVELRGHEGLMLLTLPADAKASLSIEANGGIVFTDFNGSVSSTPDFGAGTPRLEKHWYSTIRLAAVVSPCMP